MENATMYRKLISRRTALQRLAARTAAAAVLPAFADTEPNKARGSLKQSVCRWCFNTIPLPKLAEAVKGIGYRSIELLDPQEIKVVKAAGLTCAVMRCATGIENGLNE